MIYLHLLLNTFTVRNTENVKKNNTADYFDSPGIWILA